MVNQKSSGKKSLWQKFLSFTSYEEASGENAAATEAEISTTNVPAQEYNESTPNTAASAAELHLDDISALAQRLASEGEEKQQQAALAMEQANRAEAEYRRVMLEVNLSNSIANAERMQEESLQAQQQAAQAMALLGEAEAAAATAAAAYDAALAEEKKIRTAADQRIAEITSQWDLQINEAREEISELEQTMLQLHSAVETTLQKGRDIENQLEETEAAQRKLNAEGTEQINRCDLQVGELREAIRTTDRQIALLEDRLAKEQNEFTQAQDRLAGIKEELQMAADELILIRQESESLQQQQQEQTTLLQQEKEQLISELENEKQQLSEQLDQCKQAAKLADQQLADAEKKFNSCDEALRSLKMNRENAEHEAKGELQKANAAIDAAKQEVVARKEEYMTAQHRVEAATAQATQANAIAKRAWAAVERSTTETNDARIAKETALKLKTDAIAAKGTDETSVMLLGKAEMVLEATIERADKLLQEKILLQKANTEKAEQLQEEANRANTEAEQAGLLADKQITLWLDAEENLVNITARAEQHSANIRTELEATLNDLDHRIERAEDALRQAQDNLSAGEEELDDKLSAVKNNEKMLQNIQEELSAAVADYRHAMDDLQSNIRDEQDLYQNKLSIAEKRQQNLEQKYSSLSAENEERAQIFSSKLAEYGKEREALVSELTQRQQELSEAENEERALERRYKEALLELRDHIDALRNELQESRSYAAIEAEKLRLTKQAYSDACAALSRIEQESAAAVESINNETQAQLAPCLQHSAACLEASQAAQDQLPQRRSFAENAVRAAAELFNARMAALNDVEQKKLESEISYMQDEADKLSTRAELCKAELDSVENSFLAAKEQAEQLRKQEVEISQKSADNYQQIKTEKDSLIRNLEAEMEQLVKKAAAEQAAIAQAQQATAAAELQLNNADADYERSAQEKEQQLAQAELDKEALKAQMEADLAQAEEALATASDILDHSLQAAARADEQAASCAAAFEEQEQTVQRLQAEQADAPLAAAEHLNALKAHHQSVIADIEQNLSAQEEEYKRLNAEHAATKEQADAARQAQSEAEGRLKQLNIEIAAARQQAQTELQAINSRIISLREDAADKESRFREIEKTLANSSLLIEAAEEKLRKAEIDSAKALAELQSSQAARETATNLARQAAMVFESMDEATAQIMRRASDDLFKAAENATTLVEEKDSLYQACEQKLQLLKQELSAIKQKIGSAPEQLEESRNIWQVAEAAYREYRQTVEPKIADINNDLSINLSKQESELSAAITKEDRCRKEATGISERAEAISLQIDAISTQIESIKKDLLAANDAADNAISTAEATALCDRKAKDEACLAADEQLQALREQLVTAQETAAAKKEEADHAQEKYDSIFRWYEQKVQEIHAAYDNGIADTESKKARALQNMADAAASKDAAAAAYEQSKEDHHLHIQLLDQLQQQYSSKQKECQQVLAQKEQLLKSTEEEKLRLLGNCTISRLSAEEAASNIEIDLAEKRRLYADAAKCTADMDEAMEQAKQKLQQLKEEAAKQAWNNAAN